MESFCIFGWAGQFISMISPLANIHEVNHQIAPSSLTFIRWVKQLGTIDCVKPELWYETGIKKMKISQIVSCNNWELFMLMILREVIPSNV